MSRKKIIVFLLAGQVFYVIFLPFWFVFMGLSVMMFDNPNSSSLAPYILFFYIMAYPLGLLVSLFLTWIFYKQKKRRAMWGCYALPLLWIIPALLFILFTYFSP